jgi:hypothetical protein
MKKLKIGVIDLVAKGPTNTLWAKIMHANLASIMPQVVATWCEEEGHDVKMICYTGRRILAKNYHRTWILYLSVPLHTPHSWLIPSVIISAAMVR